ncbi:hypothetical protein PACTADRAFT_44505 [Pachysolen tannophilus NRRL Y-2460]|uniref:non-specific serine/threonine protein kinase n=1 Tax=Pachysolen tannophilus NRRL Y-2460 TaxID=669874 RepID=A0A1E4TRV9_PACTA|nr:hypothetical protein PACTADRAFT_44505 [Pachysolen tannophilus NRRL Y-2460]
MSFVIELITSCLPCFSTVPELKINKARFKILKLLGEGGFSYVYLVQASNGGLYALKKIRCPFGNESVKVAMKEVGNYKEFKSPYIIRSIDSSIVQEADGSKTVYILLPYFDNGSLQDVVNKNSVNNSFIEESDAIRVFIGICRGLQSMHRHHVNNNTNRYTLQSSSIPNLKRSLQKSSSQKINGNRNSTELSEAISFAHRDIKPANIMLSKDGLPVLCDLGSCTRAKMNIKNRAEAITVQELAEEHCTLPYRAPELLDVKVGDKLDEKIDIWSLGCTLYALLYGMSPFEREEQENGASMNLAISSGNYSFPQQPQYSDGIKDLIKMCLIVNPSERPSIEKVLSKALELQG